MDPIIMDLRSRIHAHLSGGSELPNTEKVTSYQATADTLAGYVEEWLLDDEPSLDFIRAKAAEIDFDIDAWLLEMAADGEIEL